MIDINQRPYASKEVITRDGYGYPTLTRFYSGENQTGKVLFEWAQVNSTTGITNLKAVKSKDILAPPVSPVVGDRYWIGGAGQGVWSGKDYQIAEWLDKIGDAVFGGTGLDDATSGGAFTGDATTNYVVEIDAAGSPDTFKWSSDGGSTWNATGVAITGSAQELNNGVTVTFAATTGHTVGDVWSFTATAWEYTPASVNMAAYVTDFSLTFFFDGSSLRVLKEGIVLKWTLQNVSTGLT